MRDYDVVAVTDCISGANAEWEQVAQKVWDQYLCVLHGSNEVGQWIDAQRAPRILDFAHMLLQVGDIEVSKRFYVDLLGFTPRQASPVASENTVRRSGGC